VDNLKSHLAVAGHVQGRSASYCSFGVATLALPVRVFEALETDAARKLLIDGLLNGAFPEEELEAEVVGFISDNRLREDDADDVINALSEREGGGQMRFPMGLGQIKYDRTAQTTIKQLHVTHRGRMERQVVQGLDANYKRLYEAVAKSLDQWWERAINRPNGLVRATRFAEKLIAKCEWYQHMMEAEAREQAANAQALNFRGVEEQIKEAAGTWLRTAQRVQSACENYQGLVNRECDLYLQQARREKAAELYGALRARVDELRHRAERIRLNLKGASNTFEQSYMDATSARGGESPFEHTIRFDAEAHRPQVAPEEFVKWRNDHYGSLSAWADVREEDVVREITMFVRDRFASLTGLSIDDVLRRSTPEQIIQDLDQLDRLAVPLWRYDDGKIPVVNKRIIQELYHYGVEDADSTVLRDPAFEVRVPRGAFGISYVTTQEPQRIILFKVKVGVPLFALRDIEEMEHAYNDQDKIVSNHIHRDWESFPGLIPPPTGGEALRWFAIAQAPAPVGSITRRSEYYYIRSQQARRVDGGELKLGQGRINAYQAFERNRDLVSEVRESVERITRTEGEAKVAAILREYADDLVRQSSERGVDPAIKEQVEREVEEIERHLEHTSKLR
jgi:hypothetical protein